MARPEKKLNFRIPNYFILFAPKKTSAESYAQQNFSKVVKPNTADGFLGLASSSFSLPTSGLAPEV